jgi:hypothetical protein
LFYDQTIIVIADFRTLLPVACGFALQLRGRPWKGDRIEILAGSGSIGGID